jgi:hypothetical protein
MGIQTVVLVADVKKFDRKELEHAEGLHFESELAIRDHFHDVENELMIYPLTEFMDAWNSTDDDHTEFSIIESWIGYVTIPN